ncbi:efflux RND transporter periplasmic adaptor subunit [Kineobactrum salinum]|uniref:HlyD family efflux transporter periplasmic adaptor subunit n=1 Tax=Kineobactrum salinum TaxID=2708301 RepID=A0A6C0U197_9GAMM|nr:HlyD family efflux transporter periplasmic adaptor subunit [Kineobactrum salinum]QIB64095.1 HlyD family efflux transporter periplasmic adaptor subunit [Kineobactrum salinum]
MARRQSRTWITLGAALLLSLLLAYAFWPRPTLVDLGQTAREAMMVTIDEEARTRVRDAYSVSAPVDGRLLRVELEAGDTVTGGDTVIARMLPRNVSPLDSRSRGEALAALDAAAASLRMAQADLDRAIAEREWADRELERIGKLFASEQASEAERDEARRAARTLTAAQKTAAAAVAMREAELANARARLISFADNDADRAGHDGSAAAIALTAPVSGRVLQILQESETTVAAGTPILEIGDTENDLEIIVELLSTDAVQVAAGNRVLVEHWGGAGTLEGTVERVEPWGFTKFSALGVEEQRVNAVIRFRGPPARRRSLGHGYRVETRIVVWEDDSALTAPSSALFRDGERWAVFVVENNRARLTPVEAGHNNGLQAQILDGLEPGQTVVLYPGPGLEDGTRVAQRRLE